MSHSQMIEDYLAGIETLRKAVAGMTPEQAKARPVPGKMSTLEVVCHLSDFEPIMATRMKRIISHQKPLLMGSDENLFKNSLFYHDRDLNEELTTIDVTRRQMARILSKLPEDAFGRMGNHAERGLVTLEKTLQTAIGHIQHHVPFILEKRKALGI